MSQQPVKEDFLDEDKEIPGQRFALLSFLSPEKVLVRKDLFFFEQFLKNYEINWKTKNLEKFLAKQVMDFNAKLDEEANRLMASDLSGAADICRQSRIRIDGVLESYQGFVKENAKDITYTTIKDSYDDYMYSNSKRLEDEFHAKNDFQTTIRGLKIRGSYGSQEEATARAKKLQRQDPIHNIFVAEVGKWLAWDPNPHEVQNQEYAEEQLNELMSAYKKNEEDREQFYSKNPEARAAKGQKRGVRTEKEIMSVVGASDEKAEGSSNEVVPTTTAGGAYSGLFDGPADLALQRKMERQEKKDDKDTA
jgi:hypothetical protein